MRLTPNPMRLRPAPPGRGTPAIVAFGPNATLPQRSAASTRFSKMAPPMAIPKAPDAPETDASAPSAEVAALRKPAPPSMRTKNPRCRSSSEAAGAASAAGVPTAARQAMSAASRFTGASYRGPPSCGYLALEAAWPPSAPVLGMAGPRFAPFSCRRMTFPLAGIAPRGLNVPPRMPATAAMSSLQRDASEPCGRRAGAAAIVLPFVALRGGRS